MKSRKMNEIIKSNLNLLWERYPLLQSIVHGISLHHARTLLVGGAVRDMILGLTYKDIDIEVHGISVDLLDEILSQFGHVNRVGKSFGVLRIDRLDIDWSIARRDASGRKPHVVMDPTISIVEAFERRDLTMNAMGIDLVTTEFIDPFNGLDDIAHKRLRTPNTQRFIEDPLRFYRVMHFIARFEMYPNDELEQLCKTMAIESVSRERIEQECNKMMLKSRRPSLGFRWLQKIDRLGELFPELEVLTKTPQDPTWHPEGNVFEHSMQALDAINLYRPDDEYEVLLCMYGALCHDLGKAVTTEMIDGRLRSKGHAHEGVAIAQRLLKRITHNQKLLKQVGLLVRYHMSSVEFAGDATTDGAYKRLAYKLHPYVSIRLLVYVMYADKRGRNSASSEPLRDTINDIEYFIERAKKTGVFDEPEKPVITGKDLLDRIPAGPLLGELVQKAYEIQINKGIRDKNELMRRIFS